MRRTFFVAVLTAVSLLDVANAALASSGETQAPPDAKATYFLWDLAPLGIDIGTAGLLRDTLNLELTKVLGDRLVVPPAWMEVEVRPQVVACGLTTECLAEVGGGLGIDRVVSGVATALGDSYNVNLKIIDTHTGRHIARAQASMTGDRNQMLAAMQTLVAELIDVSLLKGSLAVEIPLAGVSIYIDGELAGTTPLARAIAGISPGEHTLKLSSSAMKDYFSFFTVTPGKQANIRVEPEQITQLQAQLEANAPFYKRWWFWSIIGTVAVAAAGGTTYAITSRGGDDGPPAATLGTVDLRSR
jgi:hypothetical protein